MTTPVMSAMSVPDIQDDADLNTISLCTVIRSVFRIEDSRQEEVADSIQHIDDPLEPPEKAADSES